MAVSLMHISDTKYCKFAGKYIDDYSAMMESDNIIQQPNVKKLNDMADIYAIGGVELYRFAKHPNPLVRVMLDIIMYSVRVK